MSKSLNDPNQTRIDYLGPELEEGPLAAFFYFAISGQESLELHPYNQPAKILAGGSLRVFSFTIPGHEAGMNKFHAMQYWAERMAMGDYLLEDFFDKVVSAIQWLAQQKIVDLQRIAMGGLSRGGFVATHIAARIETTHTLLGFAPLTELMQLKEFSENVNLHRRANELSLIHLADKLTHVRNFRFYIGNLDARVNTDACYRFIRKLAEKNHEKHARHQKVELMITQSIGHKGHGTDPHIFEEGALFAKNHLLGASRRP
jgi:predicted esterase